MNSPVKYLTKSRFKFAYECARKLYYLENKQFGNNNIDDEFLKALAKGGFQVGALAKLYHPGGIDLEDLKTEEAIAKTEQLLQQDKVIIYEAAIQIGAYLVKVDILKKSGNFVELIEAKSKSFDASEDYFMKKRGGGILADWEPYLVDVAFQTWVARTKFPNWTVEPYLLLVDKTVAASHDGLHQSFLIKNKDGKTFVHVNPNVRNLISGPSLLSLVKVQDEVNHLINVEPFGENKKLPEYAAHLASLLTLNLPAQARPSSICKKCEFRIGDDLKKEGKISGFENCWLDSRMLTQAQIDSNRALIFELWDNRKVENHLSVDKRFLDELLHADIAPKKESQSANSNGLSRIERQLLQIQKVKDKDPTPYLDKEGLKTEMKRFKYPLHFIDFETSTNAIPFHKGLRPYETIAFQFSHHQLDVSGELSHVDQWISLNPGEFPNFEFIRRLKKSIGSDDGTVFCYARHENNVLKAIKRQLEVLEPDDYLELIGFINSLLVPNQDEVKNGVTRGERALVDMWDLVKSYYYHPDMKGSNSIKSVGPTVLNSSDYLKTKYCFPIYGFDLSVNTGGIKSLNFKNMRWVEFDDSGRVSDPYSRLPKLFEGNIPDEDALYEDGEIQNGGAAMMAWARMQYTEMTAEERKLLMNALLQYCELDTLSMAWIIEAWKNTIFK